MQKIKEKQDCLFCHFLNLMLCFQSFSDLGKFILSNLMHKSQGKRANIRLRDGMMKVGKHSEKRKFCKKARDIAHFFTFTTLFMIARYIQKRTTEIKHIKKKPKCSIKCKNFNIFYFKISHFLLEGHGVGLIVWRKP